MLLIIMHLCNRFNDSPFVVVDKLKSREAETHVAANRPAIRASGATKYLHVPTSSVWCRRLDARLTTSTPPSTYVVDDDGDDDQQTAERDHRHDDCHCRQRCSRHVLDAEYVVRYRRYTDVRLPAAAAAVLP